MRAIMDQYNVQIIPRPKQKNFHAMTIVVKGCEWECARVKEATLLLMEHLCKVRNNIDPCIFSSKWFQMPFIYEFCIFISF